jgi:hypothetical protein
LKKLTTLSAVAIAGFTFAQADVIDFQHLEVPNALVNYVGTSVTEDGWLITKNPGEAFDFAVFGTGDPRYPGSTALFNDTIDGMNRLQHGGGSVFNLTSIDLDFLVGVQVTVNFTGFIDGGGTVMQSFQTDTSVGLETFNFTGFNNLTSVEWLQEPNFHQYDNIVLNVVPEPATMVALIAGLGLLVARRRRLG